MNAFKTFFEIKQTKQTTNSADPDQTAASVNWVIGIDTIGLCFVDLNLAS